MSNMNKSFARDKILVSDRDRAAFNVPIREQSNVNPPDGRKGDMICYVVMSYTVLLRVNDPLLKTTNCTVVHEGESTLA